MNKVYLIHAEDTNRYKIGTTQNVDDRINAMKTGCPHELRLVKSINGGIGTEKHMHKKFKKYRKKGEWFEFKDVNTVINYMENLNTSLEEERLEGLKKWRLNIANRMLTNDLTANGYGNMQNLFEMALYTLELKEENCIDEVTLIINEIYFHLNGTWCPFVKHITEEKRSQFYNPCLSKHLDKQMGLEEIKKQLSKEKHFKYNFEWLNEEDDLNEFLEKTCL